MSNKVVKLTETSIMIALGTILSMIKLVDLPYGGSITPAHMLPVILICYRYGEKWGLVSGFVYGCLQLLLGMKNLSYATSFVAAMAIIFLDYLIAYATVSVTGFFKRTKLSQVSCVSLGVLSSCFLRYVCHVISGCTVWAGLSIPTAQAFVFSSIYNATYMIPETIVTCLAAVYVCSILDFNSEHLSPLKAEKRPSIASSVSGFFAILGVIVVICFLFGSLQSAETGEFTFANLSTLPWIFIVILLSVSLLCGILCYIFYKKNRKNEESAL